MYFIYLLIYFFFSSISLSHIYWLCTGESGPGDRNSIDSSVRISILLLFCIVSFTTNHYQWFTLISLNDCRKIVLVFLLICQLAFFSPLIKTAQWLHLLEDRCDSFNTPERERNYPAGLARYSIWNFHTWKKKKS